MRKQLASVRDSKNVTSSWQIYPRAIRKHEKQLRKRIGRLFQNPCDPHRKLNIRKCKHLKTLHNQNIERGSAGYGARGLERWKSLICEHSFQERNWKSADTAEAHAQGHLQRAPAPAVGGKQEPLRKRNRWNTCRGRSELWSSADRVAPRNSRWGQNRWSKI